MAVKPNAEADTSLFGATTCSPELAAHSTISALGSRDSSPEQNGEPLLAARPSSKDRDDALVANSLARRALCPDCVRLGGCFLGIPGLIPVPEKGGIEPITRKSKSFIERLIRGREAAVTGYQLLSNAEAVRGETYVSGASLCAAIRRGEIKVKEMDAK